MTIDVPQDRKSTFEPQVVKKRQKDISDIDQKIISMYAEGMTTRQITETLEECDNKISGRGAEKHFRKLSQQINGKGEETKPIREPGEQIIMIPDHD